MELHDILTYSNFPDSDFKTIKFGSNPEDYGVGEDTYNIRAIIPVIQHTTPSTNSNVVNGGIGNRQTSSRANRVQ